MRNGEQHKTNQNMCDCVLCFSSIEKQSDQNLVRGRGKFNVYEELKSGLYFDLKWLVVFQPIHRAEMIIIYLLSDYLPPLSLCSTVGHFLKIMLEIEIS